jgi:hypothetical protein
MKYVQDYINQGLPVTQAIQKAIDDTYSSPGGGLVYLPPGSSTITAPIHLKGGVVLAGEGRGSSTLTTNGVDIDAVIFDAGSFWAGLRDIFIVASQSPTAQHNAVTVGQNCPVEISRCYVWGGNSALYTKGVDGTYTDNFFWGANFSNVVSQGANWYIRCKLDTGTAAPQYGLYLGVPIPECAGAMENSFTQCDFSGGFTNSSVFISDAGTSVADTSFHRCIFSAPINLSQHLITKFIDGKFGSGVFNPGNGQVTLSGCHSLININLPQANVHKSANVGIT